MKNIKKLLLISVLILIIGNLGYSYEDYYQKVYVVKISKQEIFKAVGATEKQKRQLSKIFDRYQKQAQGVEDNLKKFDGKKEEIGSIEEKRYNEIAKILSPEQLLMFNEYINGKKN